MVDNNEQADRWTRILLSGEILKVGFLSSLYFIFKLIHHCTLFGSLISYFSGTCAIEVQAADTTSIFVELFLNETHLLVEKC